MNEVSIKDTKDLFLFSLSKSKVFLLNKVVKPKETKSKAAAEYWTLCCSCSCVTAGRNALVLWLSTLLTFDSAASVTRPVLHGMFSPFYKCRREAQEGEGAGLHRSAISHA